ncbi:YkgJ family cysteine cluster protein [Desulfobacter curvatus]|uniref:YkgJ family cysteine cluster protein n=1 Tax=Desulfobacter curvatus TaxID=2290 RepID=UPI000382EFE3|nr:YkgJ family cysteine cluster protein [Desulfobacter curvatus]
MDKKDLKHVSIPEALEELRNTMMMQSELKKQEEIGELISGFEKLEIVKDAIKVHPSDFLERYGLWIVSDNRKNFYYGIDLVNYFLGLLRSEPPETIAQVYSKIERVNVMVEKHPETGAKGLLIETEMEKFKCVQCGHCCINLSDAYETSVPDLDVSRWQDEKRYDILEWVDSFAGLNDVWINPKTQEPVDRCPWLRKLPGKDKYTCRIHETKPRHCRDFPKSKRHALDSGCRGFHAE